MAKKKCFLMIYNVSCGCHDHTDYAIGYYPDYETALKETEIQHDDSGMDMEDEDMAYGDGETSTEVSEIQEVTLAELKVLKKFFSLADVSR